MMREVERSIAAFLGTIPEQVRMWDAKVVSRMVQYPSTFEEFKAGNDITKWHIYMSLRLKTDRALTPT